MSEEFEVARAADHRRDYSLALQLLRPLAELGDARAPANFGFMHASSPGLR
jgi:hypothetical protein